MNAHDFHRAAKRKQREDAERERPSGEWATLLGWQIMDPDGWDRRNFDASWSERITEAEFVSRASMSTARHVAPITDRTDAPEADFLAMRRRFEDHQPAHPFGYVAWGDEVPEPPSAA